MGHEAGALGVGDVHLARAALLCLAVLLCACGSSRERTLERLARELTEGDVDARERAAQEAAAMGEAARPVVGLIVRTVTGDDHVEVKTDAIRALLLLGTIARDAVPQLVVWAGGDGPGAPAIAAEAVARILAAEPSGVDVLIENLADDRDVVRCGAAACLGATGPSAGAAVPALISALQDRSDEVRGRAALALGSIGGPAARAVPALVAIAERSDPGSYVAWDAVRALGGLRQLAAPAVPALVRLLHEPDRVPTEFVADTLGAIGPDAAAAVPALIEILRRNERDGAAAAARALGRIGPGAEAAVNDLIQALTTVTVGEEAAYALGLIGRGDAKVVQALFGVIRGPGEEFGRPKRTAEEALRRLGPAVDAFIPPLTSEAATSGDLRAIQCLGAVGARAASAVPTLLAILESSTYGDEARAAALRALGGIGPTVEGVLPALEKHLTDPARSIRASAVTGLDKIGSSTPDVIPILIRMLSNPEDGWWAAGVLGEFGPRASEALPALRAARSRGLACADEAIRAIESRLPGDD